MDRTPCFNTLAADRRQRLISKGAESLEDIHAELTSDMERALAGLQNAVIGFDCRTRDGMAREVLKSTADEVYSTLDFCEVMGALMLGLKDGEGQHWAELRRLVVKRYVNENADSIAEARGLA